MFGYVTVNKPEIKFKDFDMYRSFYCGLCRELRERYGIPGQISLTYDMTFVVLLLSGVYEPPTQKGTSRCAVHPLKPQPVRRNAITEYCADMNVILSYYKCMDDWADEQKIDRRLFAELLKRKFGGLEASYSGKAEKVKELLGTVDTQMNVLHGTGVITEDLYTEYKGAFTDWGTIGYEIMEEIKAGKEDQAVDGILNKCTPALNSLVEISKKLDALTDKQRSKAVQSTIFCAAAGIAVIIIFLLLAWAIAKKVSRMVLETILEPLHAIEDVAKELTEGNLHSQLEYHSEDEIGRLAHSMRKSIHILGTYVDDIDRSMKQFSEGNFDVQPEVEWRGDFVGILQSFMEFQNSMSDTVRGIQRVSDEVSNGAEQVASSSNELADGATNQAAVVEELTATVTGVSEQVANNSQAAKEISGKVEQLGQALIESNGKMQEMVVSMNEINDASHEIDKIIATINEIASQTNLLALNASIEAARAGEAGKGFAVVANQVNVLADQSAEAAKESAALIERSVNAVEKGMIVAKETAAQLEEVAENSKTITSEVTNIADTLETQTAEIHQINEGIEQINDVVQTNSATSEECAAASEEMSSEADNLRTMIRRFKVVKTEK